MNVKILLLIFSGIGIKRSTNAAIYWERVRSEYVVARGGCVASADLCGEQEKGEGITEGNGGSGIGFRVDPSPERRSRLPFCFLQSDGRVQKPDEVLDSLFVL